MSIAINQLYRATTSEKVVRIEGGVAMNMQAPMIWSTAYRVYGPKLTRAGVELWRSPGIVVTISNGYDRVLC